MKTRKSPQNQDVRQKVDVQKNVPRHKKNIQLVMKISPFCNLECWTTLHSLEKYGFVEILHKHGEFVNP